MKKGQTVTPKDFPDLKGKIINIDKFLGETVAILDNGLVLTENEIIEP